MYHTAAGECLERTAAEARIDIRSRCGDDGERDDGPDDNLPFELVRGPE